MVSFFSIKSDVNTRFSHTNLVRLYLFHFLNTRIHFKSQNYWLQRWTSSCLTFSWTEFQMLFRCCLIHKSIIILRHFLYLLYLCSCTDLGLFMLYLCDLGFFVSIWFSFPFFIFIMINHIIWWKQTYLFFFLFFTIYFVNFEW